MINEYTTPEIDKLQEALKFLSRRAVKIEAEAEAAYRKALRLRRERPNGWEATVLAIMDGVSERTKEAKAVRAELATLLEQRKALIKVLAAELGISYQQLNRKRLGIE